jgi:hypothetical protein
VFTSAVQKVSQLRVLIFLELMNIVQSCNLVERQHIGELHMSREPCETNSDQIERGLCDCGAYKVHSILLQELHVVLLMVTSHGGERVDRLPRGGQLNEPRRSIGGRAVDVNDKTIS